VDDGKDACNPSEMWCCGYCKRENWGERRRRSDKESLHVQREVKKLSV
jgi:hypothetical protein